MHKPGWLLVAMAAATTAADKHRPLVAPAAAAPEQEKPLYLFGHIPKCGGVSFVADLVGRLHLTSCFGRKAVVAKGENWTHAMERGRCNFVNTEQWQGTVQHFPRPPRVAILVRDPVHHVRSQFAHCQTPGNRAKWKLDKAGLHDWVGRWRDAVNGGSVASAFKLCHFNPLNMMTMKMCGAYNHNGLKPKHGWSEATCREKALEEVANVWHIAPLERYDQSLCVLGLRLGVKLRECSCAAPVMAFGQHKQHGVKHHDEMSAATVAIVRDLTRSDLAVYLAATGRFDRDVSSLAKGCQAEKKQGVPRQLAKATAADKNKPRTSACGPCPARATGAPRLRVEVRDFEPLPRRLVLVKVPETGSSTAANLLASLAAKRNATCYLPGAAECGADASAADWQLAHDAPGTKFALHVTTAREPMARAVSKAMKACEVGVCDYKKKKKKACKEKACSCAGATLVTRQWGVGSRGRGHRDVFDAAARAEVRKQFLARFDAVWITERYNESLVVFALRHGLTLGEVLPVPEKLHVGAAPDLEARARAACAPIRPRLVEEGVAYAAANELLDAQKSDLRARGVDVAALVDAFEAALADVLSRGRVRLRGERETLLADDCFRACAARDLDDRVRIAYGASPPRSRRDPSVDEPPAKATTPKKKGARRLAPVHTPSPRPREEKIPDATGLLAAAAARAARWNACAARFKDKGHRTDAVVTLKDHMLFVDNVKAGSATVRKRLKEAWGMTWETWERDVKELRKRCTRGDRTTTACVTEAQANATLRWAVVRDPIQKLESGVRQVWERPGHNRWLSADELVRKQLALDEGKFVDEHFEPNAWRLSGRLADGRALRLDYVLKLEELDEAWPELAAWLVRGARGSRQKTLATLAAPFTEKRNQHEVINRKTHKSSRLSPAMVARLCDSPHFADEWACFDYPRPAACGNNSVL